MGIKHRAFVNDFEPSTRTYFKEISSFQPLTQPDELDLWRRYKYNNDLKARDKIITSNLKFVKMIANGYRGRGLEYADILAEGNLGLVKALERYDGEMGNKFISYSVWWIRQTITEAIKKRAGLDTVEFEEGDNDDDENMPSQQNINEELIFEEPEDKHKEELAELMKCIDKREKTILTMYFGLNGEKEVTLDVISKRLKLSKERVRLIKENALRKIRVNAMLSNKRIKK